MSDNECEETNSTEATRESISEQINQEQKRCYKFDVYKPGNLKFYAYLPYSLFSILSVFLEL